MDLPPDAGAVRKGKRAHRPTEELDGVRCANARLSGLSSKAPPGGLGPKGAGLSRLSVGRFRGGHGREGCRLSGCHRGARYSCRSGRLDGPRWARHGTRSFSPVLPAHELAFHREWGPSLRLSPRFLRSPVGRGDWTGPARTRGHEIPRSLQPALPARSRLSGWSSRKVSNWMESSKSQPADPFAEFDVAFDARRNTAHHSASPVTVVVMPMRARRRRRVSLALRWPCRM